MPHSPDKLTWTGELPVLEDLMRFGGVPGCEYALVESGRSFDIQQAGFRRIPDAPSLLLVGPKGQLPFDVWVRGQRIQGLSVGQTVQPLWVSKTLCEATGVPNTSQGPVDLPVPSQPEPQALAAADVPPLPPMPTPRLGSAPATK
jgi:hypothetical protein